MADSEISMLPATDGVTDDTLIPVYQPGATEPAQRMNGKQFAEFAVRQVQEDLGELSEKVSQLSEDMANGLTTAQITALDEMFKVCAFVKADVSAEYNAFKTAFGVSDSGGGEVEPDEPEEPDEPVTPTVTLTGISATYDGGDVAAGTAVTDLTGIVVTAHYSDGSTAEVTGYTLSGTIAEGENTVTVIYGGKMTEFTVVGVAESGGEVVMLKNISFDGTSYLNTEVIPESVNYRYVLGVQTPNKDVMSTVLYIGGISMRDKTSLADSAYWDIYWFAQIKSNTYNEDIPAFRMEQHCMGLNTAAYAGQDKGDGLSSQPYDYPMYYNYDNGAQSVWLNEDCTETPVTGYFPKLTNTVDFTNQSNFTDDEHPIDSIWLGKVHVTGIMSDLATEANTFAGVKFYCFKVYDTDDNLIADMHPAKQGSTVGMWDNVRNKFYPATGTANYEEVSA